MLGSTLWNVVFWLGALIELAGFTAFWMPRWPTWVAIGLLVVGFGVQAVAVIQTRRAAQTSASEEPKSSA